MTPKKEEHQEEKLYGAFVSVLFVGACIVGFWLAIYFLFLSR